MQEIEFEKGKKLRVDFGGLLSKAEERVIALRIIGKNASTIAAIEGKKTDTAQKQAKSVFKKTKVDGTDNPLQVLTLKAFKNGWLSFAMLVVLAVPQASSMFARLNTRINIARLRREEVSYVITG